MELSCRSSQMGKLINSVSLVLQRQVRSPAAPFDAGEADAQFAEAATGCFGVADPSRSVSLLRVGNPLGQAIDQRLPEPLLMPPARDQRRQSVLNLAHRDLRVFPPEVPVAFASAINSSPH